jgi:GNAT superfamily N-acetyltransferase
MDIERCNEWQRDGYVISTNDSRLDLLLIHEFLATQSYWAQGRQLATVQRALRGSLNFGVYSESTQIAFARVVSDFATFAWLADVFVLPEYRGRGISKWLVEVIMSHPELQGLRRWVLATRDAHDLYRRFGFKELDDPGRWMERSNPAA